MERLHTRCDDAARLTRVRQTLDQIRTIPRNQEIPHEGAFCDLMWYGMRDCAAWAPFDRSAGRIRRTLRRGK